MRFGLAARHGTLTNSSAGLVIARHWLLALVFMYGAHSPGTAVHAGGLPGGNPQRAPEKHEGDQAQASGELFCSGGRRRVSEDHCRNIGFYNRSAAEG